MIPSNAKEENPFLHKKDAIAMLPPLNLASWAGELKRKIASSEEETASLRTRAEALRTRADALLQMAEDTDAEAQALRDLLQKVETTEKTISPLPPPTSGIRHTKSGNLAFQVRQRAKEILKAAGHPLGRTEILAQLIDDGIVVTGAKPAQRVGKILWQSKEFEYREKGYWLVGEPIVHDTKREKRYRAPNRKKNSL
ncbi:hypothetical protein [Rhizobium laguerreae]|uniref:hypothetical protein n=1 Tax=Rhizobium laguerreae TaxID=1076926 RepID=UPI001C90BDC7|nr:hypothetical protein [Rhizobium laguerreae]MBY3117318.1 hypothetical protein [Rhizobium laguerreae]